MALPMLVNGADCGPVNPLQSLAKRFDQDRGVQQDQFGSSRAGPSRETFRSHQSTSPSLNQEAAQFFSANSLQSSFSSVPAPSPFDLSLLRTALPSQHTTVSSPIQASQFQGKLQQSRSAGASWATDFLKQGNVTSPSRTVTPAAAKLDVQSEAPAFASALTPGPSTHWMPGMSMLPGGPQWSSTPLPQAAMSSMPSAAVDAALWDKEFSSHEASLVNPDPVAATLPSMDEYQEMTLRSMSELAKTAGQLVEAISGEQNPKFKHSKFLDLMRQLRDGDVVVDGNDMVERSDVAPEVMATMAYAIGKGKAREVGNSVTFNESPNFVSYDPSTSTFGQLGLTAESSVREQNAASPHVAEEDEIDAYFRQDNEAYIDYWKSQAMKSTTSSSLTPQEKQWGDLQESWDAFEASTWGVKPVENYTFQPHNPYLQGERTRQHSLHSEGRANSLYESVLELEAAVQRDPTSASAWFDLGVKQQENEREAKAIIALKRASDLDPTHLPSLLALAISHTNENDRIAADDAIEQWVRRNPRYLNVVDAFYKNAHALNGPLEDAGLASQARKHSELVDCLMSMARAGNESGVVDADVQIALAVLLNTNEEYEKAQDCFRAALSVRPDEWQLYNRVGATLANSGRAEEALEFYYRALELNPAYIRARFNLGISCINMKRFEEAAQHILDALVLQDSDGSVQGSNDKRGITSATLWDSLKTTCLHLQRIDLASLCDRRDLDGFRREFHV